MTKQRWSLFAPFINTKNLTIAGNIALFILISILLWVYGSIETEPPPPLFRETCE